MSNNVYKYLNTFLYAILETSFHFPFNCHTQLFTSPTMHFNMMTEGRREIAEKFQQNAECELGENS
jgi:hypothetical protein